MEIHGVYSGNTDTKTVQTPYPHAGSSVFLIPRVIGMFGAKKEIRASNVRFYTSKTNRRRVLWWGDSAFTPPPPPGESSFCGLLLDV